VPHCIVEHSSDINEGELIDRVLAGAMDSELFETDGSDIKVRTQSFGNYQTGFNKTPFVHVSLKLLSGRTKEQKQKLSRLVLDKLHTLALSDCSITVEVIDMERSYYSKVVT